jgi:DNA replication protein DnaC
MHQQRARQRDLTGIPAGAMTWARDYFRDLETNVYRGIGVLLRARTGRGKTLLATLMLKQAALHGNSIAYFNAGTDLQFLAAKGGWSEEKRMWKESQIRSAQVLFLDDMDESSAPHWMDGSMAALIRYRQMAMRPTYIAVKQSDEDIAKRYGTSTIDLLSSVGDEIVLDLADTWRPQASIRSREEQQRGLRRPVVFG